MSCDHGGQQKAIEVDSSGTIKFNDMTRDVNKLVIKLEKAPDSIQDLVTMMNKAYKGPVSVKEITAPAVDHNATLFKGTHCATSVMTRWDQSTVRQATAENGFNHAVAALSFAAGDYSAHAGEFSADYLAVVEDGHDFRAR